MYTTRESHCSYRLLVGQVTISPSDGTVNEGDTFQFNCTNEANTGAPILLMMIVPVIFIIGLPSN